MRNLYFFIAAFGILFFIGTLVDSQELLYSIVHENGIADVPSSRSFLKAGLPSEFPEILKDKNIRAASAVLVEADSGKVLFARKAQEPRPAASLTKLMTAIVAKEEYALTAQATILSECMKQDESKIQKFKEGEAYTIESLMAAMLIESNNVAACELADQSGRDAFVRKMNEKAKLLGLGSSFFGGPSGLDYEKNAMSAYDVAQIARYLIARDCGFGPSSNCRNDSVMSFLGAGTYALYDAFGNFKREIYSTNELWGSIAGLVAAKTGFSDEARGNLLVVVKHPLRPDEFLISVVTGSEDRAGDMLKLLELVR